MNPKKTEDTKAKNSGISLEPEMKEKSRKLAKKLGFKSLSAFTHKLLSDQLQQAGDALEERGQAKIKKARKKE